MQLLRRCQNDIPEPDLAVIASERDRPRRPFGAVERAAGDPRYLYRSAFGIDSSAVATLA
jgi:hypothetical protein